nr:hypothetical protein AYB38_gp36 [Brassica nigra]AJD85422.1 hypothetical protein BniMp042 [Brassica nigra]
MWSKKVTGSDEQPAPKERKETCFFSAMFLETAAFARQLRIIHSEPDGIFSPGILFQPGYTLYPFDTKFSTWAANEGLRFYEAWPGLVFDSLAMGFDRSSQPLYSGRLAQSLEGAGKRRLFVIGNWFKQRLLYPVHVWGMSVLRRIPQDGTFHQEGPIHRLAKRRPRFIASFDLSAATDRWPVPVIYELMACLFGQTMASCIVNGALALNSCSLKSVTGRHDEVVFIAGQPLGYYGSWALFALSHHAIVWLAALRAYPHQTRPFLDYALLGDDIVIADRSVAKEYRSLLDALQVDISDAKSIVSETGCLEFAKRFWVKIMSKDLSPVSAKAVLESYFLVGTQQLAYKYKLSPKTCLRLNKAGYRVLGQMDTKALSRRFSRIQALSSKLLVGPDRLPLEWWIGRGLPLSPYLRGVLIARIRDGMKLKQLTPPPLEMFLCGEPEAHIAENTAYRHWMNNGVSTWYGLTSFLVVPLPT